MNHCRAVTRLGVLLMYGTGAWCTGSGTRGMGYGGVGRVVVWHRGMGPGARVPLVLRHFTVFSRVLANLTDFKSWFFSGPKSRGFLQFCQF